MGTKRYAPGLISALVVGVASAVPVYATVDDPCAGATSCNVSTDGNSVMAAAHGGDNGSPVTGQAATATGGPSDLAVLGLDSLCVNTAMDQGEDPFGFCGLEGDEAEAPQLTPGMVAAAFRRIPLPASNLIIQPPNGRTLVNFATNFYTNNAPFDVPLRLLGHRIELRVRPAQFVWHYGDGASEETTGPGAAYPDLEITHAYLRKGTVRPSVDTTYAATYSVDGGPWRDVDGTVTIPGEPAQLEVLTATPTLVGNVRR